MRPDSAMTRGRCRAAVAVASTLGVVTALVLAAALIATGTSGPARADGPGDCPGQWDPEQEICIEVPLPPSESPGSPGSPGDGGGEPAVCRDQDGSVVPCSKNGMSWWGNPHWCYAAPQSPQPGPNDPVWEANDITPADGQFWSCTECPPGSTTCTGQVWFVEGGEAPVDPVAVANRLRVSLPYELADAKVAPPPTYHTYISYKNWLWVESGQWHEVTASESVGGATVTLTASPSYMSWDMGNSETVSCVGPGREWVKGMAEDAPTNCSYAYESMEDPEGDTWTVTAQINYTLAWTCTGNCGGLNSGDLGEQLAAVGDPTSITVYQRQTVVR